MRSNIVVFLTTAALFASACTQVRYASDTEYDDVYFTRADKAQTSKVVYEDEGAETYVSDREDRNSRYRTSGSNINSYRDEVYDEDDFYFSRRLRRFGTNNSSWRYYDPFFSNDLYYVMGTPAWNRWNNMGWYSWMRPRFGASMNWRFFNDPFYTGFHNVWGANYFDYYNYYNPWVNTYYGVDPFFGYNAGFGFNRGFGFGNPFWGGNQFFGGGYFCPPYAYVAGAAGVGNTRRWQRYYTGRRASSTSSVATNTGYRPSARQAPASARETVRREARTAGYSATETRPTRRSGMYLSPKASSQSITNPRTSTSASSSDRVSNYSRRPSARTRTNGPRVYTRPNSTNVNDRDLNQNSRYRRTTRPGNSSYSRPSNRYSRPSNNSYSRPSSRRSNSYSRPSSRPSSNSYSRPSSRRPSGSSYSRPSSSRPSGSSYSRPSSSRPSGSSSSSSRRPVRP